MALRCALLAVVPCALVKSDAVPDMMLAVQGSGVGCDKPDWSCVSEKTVEVPSPSEGQVLLAMHGSSVNPINVDLVEPECASQLGCSDGTMGNDGAGTVVAVGSSCADFKVGDEVWGGIHGAYAQYAIADCKGIGLKPKNLDFISAGTMAVVGVTARQCLLAAGLVKANLTVVITSGQGGTGYMAVQMAKAMGANRVITSATGDGIDFVKTLGADVVVDYHQQEIAVALENDSVDVVFDNLGVPGTADKIMHAIRPGGTFLVLQGGNGGIISDHPREGVNQVAFGFSTSGDDSLEWMKGEFEAGTLTARVMQPVYTLSEVPQAFTRLRSHGVLGKIAIAPDNSRATMV